MKKISFGLSTIALVLAGAAIAAETPQWGADRTQTRAEAKAHAEAAFDKLDLNHDGKLDKADRAMRIGEHFDKIDANHDGVISRDEFIAAHEAMRGPMGGPMGKPGEGRPPMPGMGHGGPGGLGGMRHPGARMGIVMEILHLADPDHTGTVTKDAFVGAALKLFDQADANHDGKLTPQERKAAFGKMRAHFGRRGPGVDMPPPPPPPAG